VRQRPLRQNKNVGEVVLGSLEENMGPNTEYSILLILELLKQQVLHFCPPNLTTDDLKVKDKISEWV
jgi:hypothetical protein